MITIDETKMAMALDAMHMVELQANETIQLQHDETRGEYVITDETEQRAQFKTLWSLPVPRKEYERNKAWKEAQVQLDTLRRRRVVLAIVAAVSS